MAAKTSIFFIGATGYIGGSVLSRLISHPSVESFEITVLVRSHEKAKNLEAFGVKSVIGSFKTDLELVERLAEESHVVFNCADADDLSVTKAILAGFKSRHAKSGDLPILIHTSGTGIITYGFETKGMSATDTIYDDSNAEQMEKISPNAVHRDVDLYVVEADKEGYVRTHIILPSTIYGIASNPFVDAGIMNPASIQIPMLIRASLARGRAGMVGKGLALWPDVHIDDQADLYITLYDAIVRNHEKVGHGRQGNYFGENGEHSWYDISKEIGRVMVALGLTDNDEPTSFTEEELVKYFSSLDIGYFFGTNSRAHANNSRSIGWEPKYTTKDMLASIKPEVEFILKRQQK